MQGSRDPLAEVFELLSLQDLHFKLQEPVKKTRRRGGPKKRAKSVVVVESRLDLATASDAEPLDKRRVASLSKEKPSRDC